MGNLALSLLSAGAGLVSVGLGALYVFQEKLLYFPNMPSRAYDRTPADYRLPYEDADILTHDGLHLHGWLIKQAHSPRSAPTVLYFHGNAGNIAHRLDDVRSFYSVVGCNVLMLSYRGYGRSPGRPTERAFRADARATMEYASHHPDVDPEKIYAFGRSIGGAVAVALATETRTSPVKLKGLIVENTFTSINDMIDAVMPALGFAKWLNRNRWESFRAVKQLETPVLFISGEADELVPPAQMQRLFKAAQASRYKKFQLIANGTHNDTWYRGGNVYYRSIADFIAHVQDRLEPPTCDDQERNGQTSSGR